MNLFSGWDKTRTKPQMRHSFVLGQNPWDKTPPPKGGESMFCPGGYPLTPWDKTNGGFVPLSKNQKISPAYTPGDTELGAE